MTRFAQKHPRWANSLLDGFLLAHFSTLLQNGRLEPKTLAQAWTEQLLYIDEAKRRAHIEELTPITAELLSLLD